MDGPFASLTLRRPRAANKLTPEDLPEIVRHIETVNRSPELLVLTLRSEGKHFCSGYDISEVPPAARPKAAASARWSTCWRIAAP